MGCSGLSQERWLLLPCRKNKRFKQATYEETVGGLDSSPFADLFGETEDIFADVSPCCCCAVHC
jgi:hypothetical protein